MVQLGCNKGAFEGCSGLNSVTIGKGITSIGDGTFLACENLTSIEIPEEVTYIGKNAFSACFELKIVTIGGSVTSIGIGAFDMCNKITSVYYKGTEAQWNAIDLSKSYFTSVTRYYYSETEPALNSDGTAYDGNYWHYDADGNIVVWKKQ